MLGFFVPFWLSVSSKHHTAGSRCVEIFLYFAKTIRATYVAKVLLIQFCKALLFMRCNIIIIFAKIYHKQQHWSRKCGMYRLFYFTFFLRNLCIRTFTFVLEQHRKKEIGDFACVAMDLFHFCPISFTSNFHQVYSLTNFNFMLDWLDGQGVDM